MRQILFAFVISLTATAAAHAADEPVRVAGPHGGYAAYVDQGQKDSQDRWGYAGAYRAGDYVYLSGVVTGARPNETLNAEAFKERLRDTFKHADEIFKSAGASLEEVVDIVSFHVWDSPRFEGGKIAHLEAIADVKREFMPEPHPAWTAIGISELVPDNGLVEIRMIAYAPVKK